GVVTFKVTMSEAVKVTGAPTLTLNDGGTATYAGGSGTSKLSFSHTVLAGQSAADLAVGSLDLGGGSIADGGGNAADLKGAKGYTRGGKLRADAGDGPRAAVVTHRLAHDPGKSATDKVPSDAPLSGTADPHAVVLFTVDGKAFSGPATADASGAWSY